MREKMMKQLKQCRKDEGRDIHQDYGVWNITLESFEVDT